MRPVINWLLALLCWKRTGDDLAQCSTQRNRIMMSLLVRSSSRQPAMTIISTLTSSNERQEVLSEIFRTNIAIYTAVVVERITGPNRPNCEFRVILRRFAATAWKRAKTSPRSLARIDLAASPWQRPVSNFRPHPEVSGEIQTWCHPHPPCSPDLAPCDFFLFPKIKLKLKGRRFDTTEEIQTESQRVLDTLTENNTQEAF
jgi:hypothetical protein